MAEATKTRANSPNGKAAQREAGVADRVTKLRRQAKTDADGAREEAWQWIAELGRRAVSDREGALAELQELFLCGQPAEEIDGQTEGILVTWAINPVVDKLIGSITNAWMPWLGNVLSSAPAWRQYLDQQRPLAVEAPLAAVLDRRLAAGP